VLPGETGVFFHRQTVPALQQAVRTFEAQRDTFEPARIRAHAETFSIERFRDEFQELVRTQYRQFTHP